MKNRKVAKKQKPRNKTAKFTTTRLPLEKIKTDGGTQPRSELDKALIAEYAELMKAGATFPAGVVFSDGETNWLAAGFHRYHAAAQAGQKSLLVEVHKGGHREAVLYAVGSNSEHGLRRTAADKRKAVMMLLADGEWRKWSDREIAKRTATSPSFVGEIRKSVSPAKDEKPTAPKFERGGKPATMETEKIGKAKSSARKLDTSTAQDQPKEPAAKQEPQAEPTPPPPVPIVDELGQPLPDDKQVRAAFMERDLYDDVMSRISGAKNAAKAIENHAGYLRLQQLETYLNNARAELRDAKPFAVCPYCNGKGCKGSTGCFGAKFVTKPMYERAPDAQKKEKAA